MTCNLCDKEFKNSSALNKHISKDHLTKCYICDKCDKNFFEERHLIDHKMLWHENSKLHKSNKAISKQKHPCDICDEPFDKRLEMLQHKLKMKHFKKSKCGTCGSLFKDRDSLRTHHEYSYYKCEFCEMNFCDQESLIGHVTDKHSMNDALYKCNTCDKCFWIHENLISHNKLFHF